MKGVWREILKGHVTLSSLNAHCYAKGNTDKQPMPVRGLLERAGFEVKADEINDPNHPLIDKLFDIHENGDLSGRYSRTRELILYPFPGVKLDGVWKTRWAALDIDLDKSSNEHEADPESLDRTNARMRRIDEEYRKIGVTPVFAYSWHWGLHVYIFYDEASTVKDAFEDMNILRNMLYGQGVFPELDPTFKLLNSDDKMMKVERRPNAAFESSDGTAFRFGCLGFPYHASFERIFFTADGAEVTSLEEVLNRPQIMQWTDRVRPRPTYEGPVAEATDDLEQTVKKRGRPKGANKEPGAKKELTAEDIDEQKQAIVSRRPVAAAKPAWKTMDRNTHIDNVLRVAEEFEVDTAAAIKQLSPCLVHRIVNGPKVTTGWNEHVKFVVALQLWSIMGLDDVTPEDVCIMQTFIMNHLDGENSPQDQRYYMREVRSARAAILKGQRIPCHKDGLSNEWMKEHCCPSECHVFAECQRQGRQSTDSEQEETPMLIPVRVDNPLRRAKRNVLRFLPIGFISDSADIDLDSPDTWEEYIIELSYAYTVSKSLFQRAVRDPETSRNIRRMDFTSLIEATSQKTFPDIFDSLVSEEEIVLPSHSRTLLDEILTQLNTSGIGTETINLGHEHGTRTVYMSNDLIRRAYVKAAKRVEQEGSDRTGEAIEHFMQKMGANMMRSPIGIRWQMTYDSFKEKFPLSVQKLNECELAYEKLELDPETGKTGTGVVFLETQRMRAHMLTPSPHKMKKDDPEGMI